MRRAYTLLEMMLVLALVVILAAITYPSFNAMYAQRKLSAATDATKGALATARAQAIEEGVPYRFAIVPGMGNFRLAPHTPAYWGGGNVPTSTDGTSVPSLVIENTLPQGVVFLGQSQGAPAQGNQNTATSAAQVSPDQWKALAIFLPDGTARAATDPQMLEVDLTLQGQSGYPVVIRLRCLTGQATTARLTAEGIR
jgi:prepilin-type N-terminal cleavage/methylation domain-containing protein